MVPDSPLAIAVLAGVALIGGTIDAVAGGGGLVTLPALLMAGLPPDLALGTNKGQGTFGSGSSLLTFWRLGSVDRARAPTAFALAFAGSLLGALAVVHLSNAVLAPLVLVLLVAVAVFLFFRRDFGTRPRGVEVTRPLLRTAAIAFTIGAYDGFFGPGTGTFVLIAFVLWLGDTLARGSANAKVVNFASNLAALLLFTLSDRVLWTIALPMAAGQALGGVIGARLVGRLGDRFVRGMVLVVVVALCAKLASGWLLPASPG